MLGHRIEVYWPREKKWFAGLLTHHNEALGEHTIGYDDGDTQQLDLTGEKFRWLDGTPGGTAKRTAGGTAARTAGAGTAARTAARTAGAAAARTAAAAAATGEGAAAGEAPWAEEAAAVLRQIQAVEASGEVMVAELKATLLRTPGMLERDVVSFLGRFHALPDMKPSVYTMVMSHAACERHDLVQAFVWHFISM